MTSRLSAFKPTLRHLCSLDVSIVPKPRQMESNRMAMPNFIVIGAGKSGTTALYRYLEQHPQVYMSPVKETNFFALDGKKADFRDPSAAQRINSWSVTRLKDYQALFDRASGEAALGEASPLYLYDARTAGRIRHYLPDARLIVVLRNPAERAHSAFTHLVRDGLEPHADFGRALAQEDQRVADHWSWIWHYKRMGFYYEQLNRYYDLFDREQIAVYLYEDLKSDPANVVVDIFRRLGIDPQFRPDTSVRFNRSGVPKSKALHSFLMRSSPLKAPFKRFIPTGVRKRLVADLRNRNLREPPRLSQEMRLSLAEAYRDDVLKLQDLIQRDLTGWLEP